MCGAKHRRGIGVGSPDVKLTSNYLTAKVGHLRLIPALSGANNYSANCLRVTGLKKYGFLVLYQIAPCQIAHMRAAEYQYIHTGDLHIYGRRETCEKIALSTTSQGFMVHGVA